MITNCECAGGGSPTGGRRAASRRRGPARDAAGLRRVPLLPSCGKTPLLALPALRRQTRPAGPAYPLRRSEATTSHGARAVAAAPRLGSRLGCSPGGRALLLPDHRDRLGLLPRAPGGDQRRSLGDDRRARHRLGGGGAGRRPRTGRSPPALPGSLPGAPGVHALCHAHPRRAPPGLARADPAPLSAAGEYRAGLPPPVRKGVPPRPRRSLPSGWRWLGPGLQGSRRRSRCGSWVFR